MSYGLDYQAGGGGFSSQGMTSGGGGFGGNSQSAPSSSSKAPRKAYDEQTLIPVTCKMILSAMSSSSQEGTGALELPDGRPLHHVRLIGAVRTLEQQSTNISLDIEDGTGLMTVKQWMDDNDCTAMQEMKEEACQEAIYVRIVGSIKDYDGKKTLLAHSIRKLTSGDALTHHFLDVVYSAQQYARANTIGGAAPLIGMKHSMQQTSTPMMAAATSSSSGNDLKDQVLNYIKVEGELLDVGAPVQKLVKMLSGQYQESHVRAAIEDLASEGHIYSTINEDNYKFAM